VALTVESAKKLKSFGFDICLQSGAGSAASCYDGDYREIGCEILDAAENVWESADIFLKVRPPSWNEEINKHEANLIKEGSTLISFFYPQQDKELLEKLQQKKINLISVNSIPRITRAQKMDVLSSMANIAGYRAVIEAAHHFGRFFTGQITAAGKVPPARVLVIGAGVAGLAALGAARGLGAIVKAFDTRPVVKEQVESMGASFLTVSIEEDGSGTGGYAKAMSEAFLEAELQLFFEEAQNTDIIITTALIPGKAAPRLITQKIVEQMKPGSIIVDMAAEQGGNCELTKPDEIVIHRGVSIIGHTNLLTRMAPMASQLYGNNLCHLLDEMGRNDNFNIDMENDVIRQALILHQGELTWPAPPLPPPSPVEVKLEKKESVPQEISKKEERKKSPSAILFVTGVALLFLGAFGSGTFLAHLTVFVLSCLVGWQVIWNVTPALHTPLMSVTNAISGIIIIGGLVQVSSETFSAPSLLGLLAILIATINIAGGFLVTQRMLKMFRK
jgi:NAD(P) transhydrogenase subunit alpha